MNSMGQTEIADNLVYVVDDDVSIANLVFRTLEPKGYKCKSFYSSTAMLEEVKADDPDLIILDVIMAGMDGVNVASRVRSFSSVPVMMLGVQSDSNIKEKALKVGAADYLTKPFDPEELMARVSAILRRAVLYQTAQTGQVYKADSLSIDCGNSLANLGEKPVKLTPREWAVLKVLVKYVGQVITPRQILQEAWGPEYGDEGDYIRAYVTRLRRKLEPNPKVPRYILLEWGVGYRLANPDLEASYNQTQAG